MREQQERLLFPRSLQSRHDTLAAGRKLDDFIRNALGFQPFRHQLNDAGFVAGRLGGIRLNHRPERLPERLKLGPVTLRSECKGTNQKEKSVIFMWLTLPGSGAGFNPSSSRGIHVRLPKRAFGG